MEKYEKENLIMEVVEKNYKNKKDKVLTDEDRREYVNYCICAYNVYEQLCFSGIYYDGIDDLEIREYIGYAMNVEWLKMHKDCIKKDVTYSQYDYSNKEKTLEIFDSLIDVVKHNGDKYLVDSVEDYDLFDYESEERKILGLPEIEDDDRKFLDLSSKRVYIKIG